PQDPNWDAKQLSSTLKKPTQLCQNVQEIIDHLIQIMQPHDHILIMSNKGFDGLHQRLLEQMQASC
ncbi:MAG TPA: hypothetical protein VD770_02005, partial [Coxiellaceae bacterium]|nr:hypothetical protein [Coxiellaceae bacterium]